MFLSQNHHFNWKCHPRFPLPSWRSTLTTFHKLLWAGLLEAGDLRTGGWKQLERRLRTPHREELCFRSPGIAAMGWAFAPRGASPWTWAVPGVCVKPQAHGCLCPDGAHVAHHSVHHNPRAVSPGQPHIQACSLPAEAASGTEVVVGHRALWTGSRRGRAALDPARALADTPAHWWAPPPLWTVKESLTPSPSTQPLLLT